jgi:Arc/MetJ-type ribon-helix-helix transcriptional regulator
VNTRRIAIDLPETSYELLQRSIDAGEYENESEAIADMLTGLLFEQTPEPGIDPEFDARLREEIDAAVAEHEANPEAVFTEEEVRLYLASQRLLREKEAHAETAHLLSKSA